MEKKYKIEHLEAKQWKQHVLDYDYETAAYYDVNCTQEENDIVIALKKKMYAEPIWHTSEDKKQDMLYQEHLVRPCAWGIMEEGKLVAAIETDLEEWSNRLRITQLAVDKAYRKQGMGHALMAIAKEQARLEGRRAIILETQTCNTPAIAFYESEGFKVVGLDQCAYSNEDIMRKEVRLELTYIPEKKKKLQRDELEIRAIKETDWYDIEEMTQHAFWNKYRIGCNEHYMVHQLRKNEAYVPACSLVALKDGKVIGAVLYSKAKVVDGDVTHEILTFGPLCVEPKWQGTRVGEYLMKESIALAKKAGCPGLVIFGEPTYYPRLGFKTCDHFGITTPDGQNFDAMMAYVIDEEAFSKIHGKFYEAPVMSELPEEEVEKFNKAFPELEKIYFPMQWQG